MPEPHRTVPSTSSLIAHFAIAEGLIAAGSFVGLRWRPESFFAFLLPILPGVFASVWWIERLNRRRVRPLVVRFLLGFPQVAAFLAIPAFGLGVWLDKTLN